MTAQVESALRGAAAPDTGALRAILKRAEGLRPPTLAEAASLLKVEEPGRLAMIYGSAARVKQAVFGPRVVLFAPLYLSNYCSNDCLYCGFRASNKGARRKALNAAEAVEQARILSRAGFKRLLLVAGEHPLRSGMDYLVNVAQAIYRQTDIRILHVNCAPLSVEDFKRLKAAGYGVYQCFQETYHKETYAAMHPSAGKKDYAFRLEAMDRALEAGFGDVGIGALLGLYDYKYDALATIAHSRRIEERFGCSAHTISVPRLRPAEGSPITKAPYPVSDEEFKKVVAVYRLSVPYAGVVVSTREPARLREEVLTLGASQISAGSSTEPGGYGSGPHATAQFDVSDLRELSEMVRVVAGMGLLPSLCTSCYRSGRQGEDFRRAAESGAIKDLCTLNALLSLKEYMEDAADAETKTALQKTLEKFSAGLKGALKKEIQNKLGLIIAGQRDIHF